MNKFERLFFILERNDMVSHRVSSDVHGVVKIILTADTMRIIAEAGNLKVASDCFYEIGIFQKKNSQEYDIPHFIRVKPDLSGNVRLDTQIPYKGYQVVGAVLSSLSEGEREYPMTAFKIKQEEWHKLLTEEVVEPQCNEQDSEFKRIQEEQIEKQWRELKHMAEIEQQKQEAEEPELAYIDRDKVFDRNFEVFDPFHTSNKSYRWWRERDMHKVNKILLDINIKLPFELNKESYLACELYGHILLGLYKDSLIGREFLILGIAAKGKNDPGNYYSNSRWEELEQVQTLGESGYWLTYIDSTTSKVVKVI